jgi:acyl-CoA thioester hydrolase
LSAPFRHFVRVRFRDLDPMGHAHHTLPLVYFEEARAAFWREVVGRVGLEGIDYTMGQVTVRYHRRIRFPSRLEVALQATRLGTRSFTLGYELRDEAGELLASGTTEQVMFDYDRGESKPVPPDVRAALGAGETAGDRSRPGPEPGAA